MARIRIIQRFCKGCGLCVEHCKQGVLEMPDEAGPTGVHTPVVANPSACKACMRCVLMCPDAAIEIESEQPAKKDGEHS